VLSCFHTSIISGWHTPPPVVVAVAVGMRMFIAAATQGAATAATHFLFYFKFQLDVLMTSQLHSMIINVFLWLFTDKFRYKYAGPADNCRGKAVCLFQP
jgi:hypothetical protein